VNPLNFPSDQAARLAVRPAWKVLVVDDAEEVRILTRLTLQGVTYQGRGVELLEASSADEARRLLLDHGDIAVAVIDVVMETDHAGLDLVHWIRKDCHNLLIRLLIRTGQAGLFPASSVVAEYEINDYWEKTELSFSRFHTALTTSLRGYDDLLAMHRRTLQLRQWADRFPDLLGVKDWNSLLRLVMLRLRELFPETVLSAFVCRNDGCRWPLISGTGAYPAQGASDVTGYLDEARASLLLDAWDRKTFAQTPLAQALYFEVSSGEGHLFFLDLPADWQEYEKNVTRLVLQNFRAALENRILINDLERHRAEMATRLRQKEDLTREIHHRFQASLQVVLSFIEIETRDRSGISGRSPLSGVQRRLEGLALLHSLLSSEEWLSGVNFQTFLQALVNHDRTLIRLSDRGIEYWGVPLEVDLGTAVPLALAAVEMIDLVQAPRFRREGMGSVQVVLSDNPCRLSVGRAGVGLADFSEPIPLEWQLVCTLASQLGGQATVEEGVLLLSWKGRPS
jgi:two-component sensor histidine kinase/CheY-like chemotaxis protein